MPNDRHKRRSPLRRLSSAFAGILFSGLFGMAVWIVSTTGLFQTLRLEAFDHLIRAEALEGRSSLVTTVEVDESTVQALAAAYGRFQQWPRELHGLLYSTLDKAGARAVAFDILFDAPDPVDPGSDSMFAQAVQAGGAPAVFAAQLFESGSEPVPAPPEAVERFGLPPAVVKGGAFEPDSFNSATLPFDELRRAADGIGMVNLEQDADGVSRGIKPFYEHGGKVFPAFSLSVLMRSGMAGEVRMEGSRLVCEGLPDAPLGRNGLLRMRYTGGAERYDRLSFGGVLKEGLEIMNGGPVPQDLEEKIRDRIVVVGACAAGLYDLKVSPVDEDLPGLFIHAAAIESFAEGRWVVDAPGWVLLAVVLAAALVVGTAGRLLPRWWALPCILPGLAWPYLVSRLMISRGSFVDFSAPFAAAVGGLLVAAVHRYLGEERRSARLRAAFGKYLEEDVIKELEKYDFEDISPEVGRRRRLTVLFSDVRGFTSMSEEMPPEEVVEILNEYLDVMTRVIRKRHGGTHDKYVGDAIMAFWGAPKPGDDHAVKAVEAAVDMVEELRSMQRSRQEQGRRVFGIGVGINTGEMVVGNVGSSDKLNYTVIGDEVNLGARLEALTREYDCDIIISEQTAQEVSGLFEVKPLGEATVKGKARPVRIYAVAGRRQAASGISGEAGEKERSSS